AISSLNEGLTLHLTRFKHSTGQDFYHHLNPYFMAMIAYQYITLDASSQKEASAGGGTNLARGVKVLETVSRFMPGLFPIRMALVQANIDMGSPDKALRLLAQSVRADPTQVEAYIRLARLYAQQDQHVTGAKYLEQGFAQDFAIRQHPLYAAVRAEVLMAENKIDEAIKLLREAIEVEGGSPNVSPDGLHVTLKDRSMVFCTFIKALAAGDL
ncbi:Tetratricopeptide repeat protein 21B, partial [Perkinsus olseni]